MSELEYKFDNQISSLVKIIIQAKEFDDELFDDLKQWAYKILLDKRLK